MNSLENQVWLSVVDGSVKEELASLSLFFKNHLHYKNFAATWE